MASTVPDRPRDPAEASRSARRRTFLVLGGASLALLAALRLPLVDDEANAVWLALRGTSAVLRAGLGAHGHFHPPLSDLLLSAWLTVVEPTSELVLRVPSLVFWLLTLMMLGRMLARLASSRESTLALALTALHPAHLVLASSATWYALAAFLGVASTSALLDALDAHGTRRAAWVVTWAAALVALGYTVFAWPALVLAQLVLLTVMRRVRALREQPQLWAVGLGVACVALVPTLLVAFDRMSYAVRGEAGGGGMNPAGALLALAVGQTAPAAPLVLAGSLSAVLVAAVVSLRQADRRAWALLSMSAIVLGVLAATRTLSDKRVLLGSIYLSAGLGLGFAKTRRRGALACLLAGWLPAIAALTYAPPFALAFPRYADPLALIVSLHHSAAAPRMLIASQPALVLTAALGGGDARELATDSSSALDEAALRVAWDARGAESAVREAVARERAPRTVDVVAFVPHGDAWLDDTTALLRPLGYRPTLRRELGRDALVALRHPEEPRRDARYVLLRLTRE